MLENAILRGATKSLHRREQVHYRAVDTLRHTDGQRANRQDWQALVVEFFSALYSGGTELSQQALRGDSRVRPVQTVEVTTAIYQVVRKMDVAPGGDGASTRLLKDAPEWLLAVVAVLATEAMQRGHDQDKDDFGEVLTALIAKLRGAEYLRQFRAQNTCASSGRSRSFRC